VLLALFGATAGHAVVWYTGQFYALFFLTQTLKIDGQTANILIAASLLLGTPFFIVFGKLSDRIGRKPIILAGCFIAALAYMPLFSALTHVANPQIDTASKTYPVIVIADENNCSFQFDPIGRAKFDSSCDIAKAQLARAGIPYENQHEAGIVATVKVGDRAVQAFEGGEVDGASFELLQAAFNGELMATLTDAGYPQAADPELINYPLTILILTVLVILVTMVYGPIAAWLVELFPSRIRYTSMSLPYHIGNGWFGGFLPTVSFGLVVLTGDIYYGLWYPIGVAIMTVIVGGLFLPETKGRDLQH